MDSRIAKARSQLDQLGSAETLQYMRLWFGLSLILAVGMPLGRGLGVGMGWMMHVDLELTPMTPDIVLIWGLSVLSAIGFGVWLRIFMNRRTTFYALADQLKDEQLVSLAIDKRSALWLAQYALVCRKRGKSRMLVRVAACFWEEGSANVLLELNGFREELKRLQPVEAEAIRAERLPKWVHWGHLNTLAFFVFTGWRAVNPMWELPEWTFGFFVAWLFLALYGMAFLAMFVVARQRKHVQPKVMKVVERFDSRLLARLMGAGILGNYARDELSKRQARGEGGTDALIQGANRARQLWARGSR